MHATSTREAPWYVIRSITSGFATSRCRRSWRIRWPMSMKYLKPTVDLADIRRKYYAAEQGQAKTVANLQGTAEEVGRPTGCRDD